MPPTASVPPPMSDLRLRARSVTEIVDAAFQLYRRDALEYILVTAVAYSPLLILQLMLFGAMESSSASVKLDSISGLWFGLLLLGFVGYAIMVAVVSKFSSDIYLGRTADLGATIRLSFSKVLPLIGASLLFGLLVSLGVLLFAVSIALWGPVYGSLGFVLAVVWALWVVARYFAVFQVIILENRGVIDAFSRAGALSRGQKGHVVLTLFLVLLIITVVAIAVMTVAALLPSQMIAGVVQMVYTVVAYPLIGIAQMILYYDLRIRAEGFDIEVMTGALGAAPRETEPAP